MASGKKVLENLCFSYYLQKDHYNLIKIFRKTKFVSIISCYIRLKVVMAEKDLSNIWLSKKLGVSQATVSKWMTNFSQPNLETLIKISKVLNVEITELIRTEEVQIEA